MDSVILPQEVDASQCTVFARETHKWDGPKKYYSVHFQDQLPG